MSELVTCKDLTKRFGNHTALDHLNISTFPWIPGKLSDCWGPTEAERRRS